MNKPRVKIITDLQFGSTGKGLIAGYLAKRDRPDVVVTAWSPSAGHTFVDSEGRKYVHTMLANGIVSPDLKYVLIGPGSVVNLPSLFEEIKKSQLPRHVDVLIHPSAAIVAERHRDAESTGSMVTIGSTRKGSGAALVEKIQRDINRNTLAFQNFALIEHMRETHDAPNVSVTTHETYEDVLSNAGRIQVEGAQGFSLGINSGFWPHTTSRECTPAQIASDCLIPLSWITDVIGTMRTYPIRVANRFDPHTHQQVGFSGPGYPDQSEIKWEEIGQDPELTTVTKLPRRIFTFSKEQIRQAIRRTEPTAIFLNFANYLEPQDCENLQQQINHISRNAGCGAVRYIGNGPTENDVVDVALNPNVGGA